MCASGAQGQACVNEMLRKEQQKTGQSPSAYHVFEPEPLVWSQQSSQRANPFGNLCSREPPRSSFQPWMPIELPANRISRSSAPARAEMPSKPLMAMPSAAFRSHTPGLAHRTHTYELPEEMWRREAANHLMPMIQPLTPEPGMQERRPKGVMGLLMDVFFGLLVLVFGGLYLAAEGMAREVMRLKWS